jgi:pimeloyl-ACP methyl ester carboxylesterase
MKSILIFTLLTICLILDGQERYVNIDGQKFRIKEFGKGNPTVIFESGMSDSLEAWGSIPDTVALFTHVFLYDRADIGKSDTSREERTIPNMVYELKRILDQQKIGPPFILVGHSLGGYITRYFSSQFANNVKGLLLLDPAPEAYWESMSEKELEKYIAGGTEWYRTRFKPKYWKEWFRFIPNKAYMKKLNISNDLHIILVSATESNWYKYQKEQIKDLNNARQIELTGGHYIYRDHPDLIVKYIRELTSAAGR